MGFLKVLSDGKLPTSHYKEGRKYFLTERVTTITQEDVERITNLLKANKKAPLDRIAALAGVGVGHVRTVASELVKEGVIQERKAGTTAGANTYLKRLHADPEFAARHAATASENLKRLHADPEFAARHAAAASERMKRLHADPEFAAAHAERSSKIMTALHADPEFAARHAAAASENMKRLHADPEFAARHAAAASENMKQRHALRRAYGDYWKRGQPHPPF